MPKRAENVQRTTYCTLCMYISAYIQDAVVFGVVFVIHDDPAVRHASCVCVTCHHCSATSRKMRQYHREPSVRVPAMAMIAIND